MKFNTSLLIFIGVFSAYFTSYASVYSVYACMHKIDHASPFWTIVKSDKNFCGKVLDYATYVSCVYASPLLLAADTASDISGMYVYCNTPKFEKFGVASICVLLFYRIASAYQAYNLGGPKIAVMQFFDFLAIVEASASFSEGYLHYLFIWISRLEGLMEAVPQMIITIISIASFERRKELEDQDMDVLILSVLCSYAQVVLKIAKNDEGSLNSKNDCGIVKYGRFALRAVEILNTTIFFVLLTYWQFSMFIFAFYITVVFLFYLYFFMCTRKEERFDEIDTIITDDMNQEKFDRVRNNQGMTRIDRLILFGDDMTNLFISVICSPLFIPTRFYDFEEVEACFFYAGQLPLFLKNMKTFFPSFDFREPRFGGLECYIQTSRFTYHRNREDSSCSRSPTHGKKIYGNLESEGKTYLPFNFFIFMARGLLQSLCLMPVIFKILLSETHADDRIWMYVSFSLMAACISMQGIILYMIEYAFEKACRSTFSTTAAINSSNSRMASELLWLNKQPSMLIGGKTLVSVATGHNNFPVPLVNKILSNGFNPNQRIEKEQTVFMLFLKNNHAAAIRHLFDKCDVDVTATTDSLSRRGIMHYAVRCDLEIIKYLVRTLEVPHYTLDYYGQNILFADDFARTHDEINEKTLDYFIDDLHLNCKKTSKHGANILMEYIENGCNLRLDRIIYWIEKREIDPWDCDDKGKTLFDYLEERINEQEHVDEAVRQYLLRIKDKKCLYITGIHGENLIEV